MHECGAWADGESGGEAAAERCGAGGAQRRGNFCRDEAVHRPAATAAAAFASSFAAAAFASSFAAPIAAH